MKLSYSIAGKLWWITEFLDYHMYKGIHDAIIKERAKINLHTTKGVWTEGLIENLVPPMRVGVSNYKPFDRLKTLVKHNAYFQMNDVEEMSTTIHYMNHRWLKNWGGELMFTDGNGHGWIPPIGNSLIILKAPIVHKVNPVLSPLMPRISIQMFMK